MRKSNEEIAGELLHLVSTKRLVEELSTRNGVNRVEIDYLEPTNINDTHGDEIIGPAIILVVTD